MVGPVYQWTLQTRYIIDEVMFTYGMRRKAAHETLIMFTCNNMLVYLCLPECSSLMKYVVGL